ncbi:MAG TPA: disulfide bond formation protein B [Gammaproteobacteria bacterium]|jgi:disulfide bond formation protein DsbB|nr:disulfide bond formation protein B [Gammaproteobacteria bacterium]
MILSRRQINLAGFLVCAALLAFAYYSQFHDHLEPCPLCIFQRIGVIALGVLFLAASVHHPKTWGAKIYGCLLLLAAAAGGAVSIRHIYIQHLPPEMAPPCGPGIGYLFAKLPFSQFLVKAFTGSADCSVVTWSFLGLTMPEWVLIWFVILGVGGLVVNWRKSAK